MAEQNILAGDVNVLDQMINDLNVHKETIERQGRLAESIGDIAKNTKEAQQAVQDEIDSRVKDSSDAVCAGFDKAIAGDREKLKEVQNKRDKAKLAGVKELKLKAIKGALKQLEKTTKKEGIAYVLGEKETIAVETISTGSLMFDLALGVGGLPKGRIIEFYGAESSGKTLTAIKAGGECQKAGGVVAIVDMEHTFDPTFATKLGLDCNEVILSQPDHMQDAFKVIDALIDAGVDLIILDSVAALVPQEELEGEIGKQTIGLVARYMSQFLRRITGKTAKMGSTVIFINQVRDAIGVMYGDPTTTPGGRLVA